MNSWTSCLCTISSCFTRDALLLSFIKQTEQVLLSLKVKLRSAFLNLLMVSFLLLPYPRGLISYRQNRQRSWLIKCSTWCSSRSAEQCLQSLGIPAYPCAYRYSFSLSQLCMRRSLHQMRGALLFDAWDTGNCRLHTKLEIFASCCSINSLEPCTHGRGTRSRSP